MPNSFYTKKKFSEVLSQAIKEFEQRGGVIQKIPTGVEPREFMPKVMSKGERMWLEVGNEY